MSFERYLFNKIPMTVYENTFQYYFLASINILVYSIESVSFHPALHFNGTKTNLCIAFVIKN